jgi:aspartyl-tRNA(Asn)/glutamyl-tRNA(Gln) amidotransferase subunit A
MALHHLTVTEAIAGMERGEMTSLEIVDALLAQIDRFGGQLNCFITARHEEAREAARQVGAGGSGSAYGHRGAGKGQVLRGVPLVVKDNIATAGVRSTAGSKILADYVPEESATVWQRLADAGAILLGKANLHEFAMGGPNNPHYGPAWNPWDTERIPGPSSNGSAAAVAARMAPASLGTDAAGSVRIPASFCNLVGLKATHGLVPLRGGIAYPNPSVDHVGPLTRSVADAALLLSVMAGYDAQDPSSSAAAPGDYLGAAREGARMPDLRGVRIGIAAQYFSPLDPGVGAAVKVAIDHLAQLGAEIREVTLPDHDALLAATGGLQAERAVCHDLWMRTRLSDYGQNLQVQLLASQFILGTDYARAVRARRLLRRRYEEVLQQVDLLAGPTVPVTAPTLAEMAAEALPLGTGTAKRGILTRNTRPANLAGVPAISVPCGFARGLPVGLQLIGRHFDEERLLRCAAAYEATTEWHRQRPPLAM